MGLLDGIRKDKQVGPDEVAELAQQYNDSLELAAESIRVLEDSVNDAEWRRIGTDLQKEFTRDGLDRIVELSRAMYLSHPLIQRAINVTTYYTWGQGVDYSAHDQVMDKVINPMLDDPGNQAELYSHQARLLTDVDQLADGNTFFALFKSDPISVRSIPSDEIRQIHRNPDDKGEVWFYRRVWNARQFKPESGREETVAREMLYPDVNYDLTATSRPDTIGGVEVAWASPVIHQKTGGLKHMSFGVPSTYAALDWARAYRKFLEDWHTIVSSLARFAWRASAKGSKQEAIKRAISANRDGTSTGTTPPPAGSVWLGTEDDTLTPIPKTGAHTSADDARPSRLMVAAAMDLPDTILSGDADVGNLATAKSLDRPTELAMASRQQLWSHWDKRLFTWACKHAQREGKLGLDEKEWGITVSFPSILEHDQAEIIKAIVSAATLDGRAEAGTLPREQVSRMLMDALGVEDVDGQLSDLDDETRADVAAAVERLREVL